jgi:hypothetical protein
MWIAGVSGRADGGAKGKIVRAATVVSGGVVCSIGAAQQVQVHRTQNAGQPLSGADSLVPIGQVSGTSRELTPLASAISTASTAMNSVRRIPINIPSVRSCAPAVWHSTAI